MTLTEPENENDLSVILSVRQKKRSVYFDGENRIISTYCAIFFGTFNRIASFLNCKHRMAT